MSPPLTTGRILLDVAVILLAARAGGLLLERFGQPGVIGELAAGVLLGPTLLGAFPGDPSEALFPADAMTVLRQIGQLGLVLFMFTVGWDLDLRLVRRRGRAAATVSVASTLVPFALGLALAAHLHDEHDMIAGVAVPFWPFALFVGASLAVTAFPVLARILRETGLAGTPLGALVLSAAAVDDIIGWTALAVAVTALEAGDPWDYARIVIETALFVVAVVVVVRPLLRRLLRSATPSRELLLVPVALGGAYLTEAIGIHAAFGAFMVGAAMPRHDADPALAEIRRRLSHVSAVLVPIYFVTSGMLVDIPGLQQGDLADLVLIIFAACAGKFLGAFGGARLARVSVRDSAAIGVMMNTRGVIEIVLLTVGREQGLIDDRLFTMLALMAIFTTLLTSPLLRAIVPDRLSQPPAHA
jgi:Kef-type K+ transport system membrane component KefB